MSCQEKGLFTLQGEIPGGRYESAQPVAYRLCRIGREYVLQGLFRWQQGPDGGEAWRDLPTLDLTREGGFW